MELYYIKPKNEFLIMELLKEAQNSQMNEFCIMWEYQDYLLFKGETKRKYEGSDYSLLDIPTADAFWTSGGISVFSPGSIVIAAFSDSEQTLIDLRTKIYGILCTFLQPLNKFTQITKNDVEVDHRKISGCFINKTPQNQFALGLYVNNVAPNSLIDKVTTNPTRFGAGLLEFNIDKNDIINRIQQLFEKTNTEFNIEKIKRP